MQDDDWLMHDRDQRPPNGMTFCWNSSTHTDTLTQCITHMYTASAEALNTLPASGAGGNMGNVTGKPCCRKETERCRVFCLKEDVSVKP